ncbi:MAG TPA: hypothetical protein VLD19_16000 [Chitinophagaceae bacterium]|nr:hypothetical protein [Chitinophagaceae bacterium]
MDMERYAYRRQAFMEYEFYSEGPHGRIRKIVCFQPFFFNGLPCHNLSFGDWNEELGNVDDSAVSNNGDAGKVLATIARIILYFTTLYPDLIIHVKGRGEAKARLYQMGVNKIWSEIRELFDAYGDTGEQWEPFQKNVRYHAFLLQRIEYVNLEEQNTCYMPSSTKKTNKKKLERVELIEFIVPEPSTNPFLIRKMEDARKSFETSGFPRELFERNRSRIK